jgi:hypothetical protein
MIRSLGVFLAAVVTACSHSQPRVATPPPRGTPAAAGGQREVFASDVARVTPGGVRYTVPAGWTLTTRAGITIVSAQEGDLHLAIVETGQRELEAAISDAWQRYGQQAPPRKRVVDGVTSGGWDRARAHAYELPAGDERAVVAELRWHGETPVVLLLDAARATMEKRGAQFALLDHSVQPAGYSRESFAGKTANELDRDRLGQLDAFIERGRVELAIPGAAIAITQGGEVVHARGYGVRELDKPAAVDSATLFRVASNTKALTSLLLARLADAGKLRWDQPVIEVYPNFALADSAITAATRIEHLLCACTGPPRTDLERLFEFGALTPELLMSGLSTIQPTTGLARVRLPGDSIGT